MLDFFGNQLLLNLLFVVFYFYEQKKVTLQQGYGS